MHARELDDPELRIKEPTGGLGARRLARHPDSCDEPLLRPPVPGVHTPAARAREPAEEAPGEPHRHLGAAFGATPFDRTERGQRRGPRQRPPDRGLVPANGLDEVRTGAGAAPQDLLAGEKKKGIEPAAGAGRVGLSRSATAGTVDAVFEAIREALAKHEEVRIAGFGTFATKHRSARTGRNPRTGEAVSIPASVAPAFRAGKALKDAVNGR